MNDIRKTATQLHQELNTITAQRNQWAAAARQSLDLGITTDLGAREHMAAGARRDKWDDRLTAVRDQASGLADVAARSRSELRQRLASPPTKDTSAALLAELQLGRTWAHHQRTLDALEGVGKVSAALDLLKASSDPLERAVLLQELPSYLTATVPQISDPTKLIDEALAATVPEFAEAAAAEVAAAKLRDVITYNAAQVEGALNGYAETTPNLIDPTGIQLGAYDPHEQAAARATDAA